MEKITSMKIIGLTFTNFRNHTEQEHYSFGDISCIMGHNGAGKTTMAHGIAYALYGVSYFGEQKIERLINENASETQVQLEFTDQNGTPHTLTRSRKGEKTSLTLDSYTLRQKDLDYMICDKDTFLSMFNPTYLTERLSEKGRELILRYLSPVPKEKVLEQMGALKEYLNSLDFEHQSPEVFLKGYREALKQTERQMTMLEGNIESIKDTINTSEQRLHELYNEMHTAEKGVGELAQKQFNGIDLDDLAIQRDLLISKLSKSADNSTEVTAAQLQAKLEQAEQREYVPKFTQAITETQTKIKLLRNRYEELKEQYPKILPGTKCPTCLTLITDNNLSDIKNGIKNELADICQKGEALTAQKKELEENERKSYEVFKQFKTEDITKFSTELNAIRKKAATDSNRSDIQSKLDQIEYIEKYGNLSESEYTDLISLQAEITGLKAQIKAIEETVDEERLNSALKQKKVYEEQTVTYSNFISALTEYISKRAELATEDLQMPNVKIRLFDVLRTTGEVVGVFKFSYKGRDYSTLSLSEKTLAGIEIAAMIRKITGIDCPICVDNTESIAAFNTVEMPSQSLLLRFVKDQPLTVQSRNKARVQNISDLRKAS